VNIHNEALFGNSTFTGKEGVTELLNMLKPEESDSDEKGRHINAYLCTRT
jgi:hypothetical protein